MKQDKGDMMDDKTLMALQDVLICVGTSLCYVDDDISITLNQHLAYPERFKTKVFADMHYWSELGTWTISQASWLACGINPDYMLTDKAFLRGGYSLHWVQQEDTKYEKEHNHGLVKDIFLKRYQIINILAVEHKPNSIRDVIPDITISSSYALEKIKKFKTLCLTESEVDYKTLYEQQLSENEKLKNEKKTYSNQNSKISKERNTAQKMFAAIVDEKFKGRLNNVCSSLYKTGFTVSENTVRSHYRDGKELLSNKSQLDTD
jgi:hypothetical protein